MPASLPRRRPIIGTSWKMNLTRPEARRYLRRLRRRLAGAERDRPVFVLPPFTDLSVAEEELAGSDVLYGAQDVHPDDAGAHTGDVSAPMLAELGCRIVEVGHSERRRDHGETDELIARKVAAVLRHGMWPLLCIGESAAERDAGEEEDVVLRQLQVVLGGLSAGELDAVLVAYEPWWAIGAGATAAPLELIARLHRLIRGWLDERAARSRSPAPAAGHPAPAAGHGAATPVLYGGSVDPSNAAALLAVPHVDGLFVGRAALDPDLFADIVLTRPAAIVARAAS